MTLSALLFDLCRRGVVLTPAGDRLHYRAPLGVLTAADREALRRHRDEVLALLREVDGSDALALSMLDGAPGPTPLAWRLVVASCAPVHGPIPLNRWTTITDPTRCIEADLAELARLVAARNAGREHWSFDTLVVEALDRLRACGVIARVEATQ